MSDDRMRTLERGYTQQREYRDQLFLKWTDVSSRLDVLMDDVREVLDDMQHTPKRQPCFHCQLTTALIRAGQG